MVGGLEPGPPLKSGPGEMDCDSVNYMIGLSTNTLRRIAGSACAAVIYATGCSVPFTVRRVT